MNNSWNLDEIARQAMLQRGLFPDFPNNVLEELKLIQRPAEPTLVSKIKDLRQWLWFSIDNDDSMDLDQLTYAEITPSGSYKIYVAIADVDALVLKDSAIDFHASLNSRSIYAPTKVFPMLPEKLSTDLTSLCENQNRTAIVIEVAVEKTGEISSYDIYRAYVYNHAKLAYSQVGPWLENLDSPPPHSIFNVQGLSDQVKLQDQISVKLKKSRHAYGALSLKTIQAQAVIQNEKLVGLKETEKNRARDLIENFMIAANVTATKFLTEKKFPTFRRVVKTPKKWDRIVAVAREFGEKLSNEPDSKALEKFLSKMRQQDPERFPDLSLTIIKLLGRGEYVVETPEEPRPQGHFALALSAYSHATAPNRRYPDLIVQRLLKSAIHKNFSPYSLQQLNIIAQHCTEREAAADKVERHLLKSAAAIVLSSQINQTFDSIVTGQSDKGTWVRLRTFPIEGKLIQGFQGIEVGDYLKVKLVRVDIPNGFIDFIRES